MPNTYKIKRVMAYENGKEGTIKDIKHQSENEKYIEVLIPFSDPIAESPELQDASVRAMNHPHTTDDIFVLLNEIKNEVSTRIILSIYLNTAFAYGYDEFCKRAKESGVYALKIKDMPFKERQEIEPFAQMYNLNVVHTLASNRPELIREVLSVSEDLVYISPAMQKKCTENELKELFDDVGDCQGIDVLIEK